MAEYWGIKVEDIFNTMKERFRPEGAKDVDAVFGYDIEGRGQVETDGKEQRRWRSRKPTASPVASRRWRPTVRPLSG